MQYQGKSGKTYEIEEPELASGGEGSIYAIRGYKEIVLKIFKENRRTKAREEKLLEMVKYQLNEKQLKQVMWPRDVVYNKSGFVGYVMPRLWENRNLNVVYSAQCNKLDLRHRLLIAYNLCAAVDTVHSLNQVCGDLNPQNICVNLDLESESALRITLVDTDSYHITDGDKVYRCEVGLANYLAPEIQKKLAYGQDLRTASLPTYTKETDLFALAVHIFALIMNGCHPFACAKRTSNGYENTMKAMDDKEQESVVLPQPVENIRDGFFPFYQERSGVTYPLYAPDFNALPQAMQDLFIRAFVDGYDNPTKRPTTGEWINLLKKYQSLACFNQCEKKHYYLKEKIAGCPYCKANSRMLQMMYQNQFDIHDVKESALKFQQNKKLNVQNVNQGQKNFKSGTLYSGRNVNHNVTWTASKIIAISVLCVMAFFVSFVGLNIGGSVLFSVIGGTKQEEKAAAYITQAKSYVSQGDLTKAQEILNQYQDEGGYSEEITQYLGYIEVLSEVLHCVEEDNLDDALFYYDLQLSNCGQEEILAYKDKIFEKLYAKMDTIINKIKNKKYSASYRLAKEMWDNYSNEIYYQNGAICDIISDGVGFYSNGYDYVYYGEWKDGVPSGTGVEVGMYGDGYYRLSGTFQDGYANGECTLFFSDIEISDGTSYKKTIKGNFTNGYEDGNMSVKIVYLESKAEENFQYKASMGEYTVLWEEDGRYVVLSDGSNYWSTSEEGLKDNGAPRRK